MSDIASVLLAPGQALGLSFDSSVYLLFLLCCSAGLHKTIYAVGIGYGLCMLATSAVTWSLSPPSAGATGFCGLYFLYGLRLVAYLLRRELSDSYNTSHHGRELRAKADRTRLLAKCFFICTTSLSQYGAFCALQPLAQGVPLPALCWVGLGVSATGFLLEAAADEHKLMAKATRPNSPVTNGVFRIARHPNYLGEILLWLGILTASQLALPGYIALSSRFGHALGPLLMIWVMFQAAKRLDKASAEKYRSNPEYQSYLETTPSLWPRLC